MNERLIETSDKLKRPSRGSAKYIRRIKAQERRGLLIQNEIAEAVTTSTRVSLIDEQAQTRIERAIAKRRRQWETESYNFRNRIGLNY